MHCCPGCRSHGGPLDLRDEFLWGKERERCRCASQRPRGRAWLASFVLRAFISFLQVENLR